MLAASVTLALACLIGGAARAEGVTSGSFELSPGTSRSADSGQGLGNGSASATFTLSARPAGGGIYVGVDMRSTPTGSGYRAKARVLSDGTLRVGLSKVTTGGEVGLGSVPAPGAVGQGSRLHVEGAVSGTPAVLAVRAWVDGSPRPGWQFSGADASAPALPGAGTVRAWSYLSTSAQPLTAVYRDLMAANGPVAVPDPAGSSPTPGVTPGVTPGATSQPAPGTASSATASSSPSARASTSPSPSTASPSGSIAASTQPPSSAGSSSGAAPAPSGGKPGPATTGVPAGTTLKVRNGDLIARTAGATYDKLDIRGFVVIEAPNVTIKRSIIRGGAATSNRGVVTNTSSAGTNFVLQDSEIAPSRPSVWLDGVKGSNFTLRRVDVHGGVDAVKVHGSNVRVESSWLHGLSRFSSDPNQGGRPTHNDGVQVLGGGNITIVGNTIDVRGNAGMQVTQDYARTTGLVFSRNWADGGECTVKLNHKGASRLSQVVMQGNRFGHSTTYRDCAILRTSATSLDATGNVWADTGKSVPVKVDG